MKRRHFVRTAALGAVGSTAIPRRLIPQEVQPQSETRLVILHTNDTHSRIDPFPQDAGRNAGLGGAARRASLIEQVRTEHEHVLLLDSGDIFQGTPYYNLFGGEIELRVMSEMGYDVGTLGNHEFDSGTDGLVDILPHANFDFVCANYEITHPGLSARVAPYTIRDFGGVKVGVLGVGIDFYALVLADLHEGVSYTDPIGAARRAAEELRNQGCSLVICLSHLGYQYDVDRPSDLTLAELVPEVDLILGGHTHTFMDKPDVFRAGETGLTIVNQVGFGGLRLGRIDVTFGSVGEVKAAYGMHYTVKPTRLG